MAGTGERAAAAVDPRPCRGGRSGGVVIAPTRNRRLIIAGVAFIWGAALAFAFMQRRGFYPDFLAFWYATRAWLGGLDPYLVAPSAAPYFVNDRFFYPFPSVLALLPFAPLPLNVAGPLFFGLSSALLAFAVTNDGYARLPLFLSFPYVMAASLGQWAPLIMAAVLLPGLGFLAVCKPNIGLALAFARPTRAAIFGGAAVLLGSLAFDPQWPLKWVANLRTMQGHPPPFLTLAGVGLLVAALRWRREDGRLVLGMAAVPQMPMFADQLPLMLVARTRVESMVLALLSHVGGLLWVKTATPGDHPSANAAIWVIAFLYYPALALVLRRPNEGSWLKRLSSRAA
jgi:hypothetical protein